MMTVLAILSPLAAFIAFLSESYVLGALLAVLSLMLWRAMLNR